MSKPTSPTGVYVKSLQEQWAFVPHPLPPKIQWPQFLVSKVAQAEQAMARLDGYGARFPNPRRLCRLFLKREAEMSSRIEKTYAGLRTMVLSSEMPSLKQERPSVIEVENNFRILEFAFDRIESRQLTLGSLRHMHQMLFDDLEQQPVDLGRLRSQQNFIGNTESIREARYIPPPSERVNECMQQLIDYINHPDDMPPIVRAAIVHYQFEAIHPFSDGNGRIGRALIMTQLHFDGAMNDPLLNPSAYMEKKRRQYYDCLRDVTEKGDWVQWISFFCEAIVAESRLSVSRLARIEAIRKTYHERVQNERTSGLLIRLIEELIADPVLTGRKASELLSAALSVGQRSVEKLRSHGIVREVTGARRNRIYLAQEILDIFDSKEEPDSKAR